jgi:hypothetical protein
MRRASGSEFRFNVTRSQEGTMGEGTSTADRAKEQVQEQAQVAQEKAKETAATMQSRIREQVDQRSTQAGEQVSSSANALRSTSERLREEGQDGPARAAERAADQAERLGGYLTESSADRILGDVEDFGRRQPLAVVAIGVAAGFAASRFLKASSSSRYASRQSQRFAAGDVGALGDGIPGTGVPAVPVAAGTMSADASAPR